MWYGTPAAAAQSIFLVWLQMGGRTKTSDFNYTSHVIIYMRFVSRGGSERYKNKHDLCMCILTSCSEHITSSVHLPSHFPILEGSGRGLEPRRLRGKDESPFRSRLAKRLGSHHSLQKWPDQGLLTPCRSGVSVTASNPSWPLGVIGEFPCVLLGKGGSTSHGPAAVQPTPKTGPPRPHLPERGHTKAQRKTESCHEEPPAMNQNEYHMMPNHTVEKGRRGASPQCYYD